MDFRHIRDELLRVDMLRLQDDPLRRPLFHDAPLFHNIKRIADIVGQPDVMRDENDRHPVLLPQLHEHVENGGAGARVDHRCRLVGDQDARPHHEDAGDHEPLHLASGQLERVLVVQLVELQVDERAGIDHSPALLLLAQLQALQGDAVAQQLLHPVEHIE